MELEEELKVVGNSLKSLEVSEEKVLNSFTRIKNKCAFLQRIINNETVWF